MRRVLIGVPAYGGRVHMRLLCDIASAAKLFIADGVDLTVCAVHNAEIGFARDQIVEHAYTRGDDDLVMIDDDQTVSPDGLWRLLSHDEPFVAAAVRKKGLDEAYNIQARDGIVERHDGLWEVNSVGTGLLRLRQDAIRLLVGNAPRYVAPNGNWPRVFYSDVVDGERVSEDFVMCRRWQALGGRVVVDPTIVSPHFGEFEYAGNAAERLRFESERGSV